MQGRSFVTLLASSTLNEWEQVAYHRCWMHRDAFHDARAHYRVRNQRLKIIYWYNKGFGLPGMKGWGEQPEWELFDCTEDPLELANVCGSVGYESVVKVMTAVLEKKMAEIGDEPEHLLNKERHI